MAPTRQRRGFTLIELLVSVAIFGVVAGYLFETFSSTHRAYVVVDSVSEVQQNIQALADRINRDIRAAGYSVPEHAAICAWDATTGPDTLFVSNSDAIRTADQLAAIDPLLTVADLGAPVTGTGPGWTSSSPVSLSQSFVDVAADGADFAQNGGVILVDRNDANGRAACGIITNANPGTTLQVDFGGTVLTASGAPDVVAVPASVYRIVQPAGQPSQLQRNGLTFAQDVEDLQVAMFFDANGDRVVDPNEFVGDGVGADYDPSAVNGQDLRDVRFNLVLVTREPDPRESYDEGRGQATENRTAASLSAQDGLRRRVHSETVRLRNVGNR